MTDSEVNKSKEYVSKVRAESLKVREIANKVEEMMPRINNVIANTNWFYGVVVSTLDFESSDLGSTPGRTFFYYFSFLYARF
ncbi:hypothetical protein JHK85_011528 [Glycine max]|uniref:Uncharacterized protein n=1 Tax=Glycine max TaxID=3847 RepID=A0A0R0KC54_SOYBN|nr:hypothetical protein JHK87_011091 [Glycine soja]KAG5050425.1 hypothetical protein JHK85_011528 [Glycine max]KAH1113005.1 hypothetical protein GYH30_010956 [Glycine max]